MKKLAIALMLIAFLPSLCVAEPTDKFWSMNTGLESPARSLVSITPSDSTILDQPPRALTFDGGPCDLVVLGVDDSVAVTVKGRITGVDYPYRVKVIYNSTTCTNIIGVY